MSESEVLCVQYYDYFACILLQNISQSLGSTTNPFFFFFFFFFFPFFFFFFQESMTKYKVTVYTGHMGVDKNKIK